MDRKYYVYEHREADTGRTFYVGKGHGRRAYYFHNRSRMWNNIKNKHGVDVVILYEGLTEADSFIIEGDLISAYGRENLCNLTDGGEGMSNPSSETRLKLSISHMGIKKSHEEVESIRARMSGNKNYWYGKSFEYNHRKKLSDALRGRKLSKEHSKKIGESVTKTEDFIFFNENCGSIFMGPRNIMLEFGLSKGEISLICTGKRKIAKGWCIIG